MASLFASVNQGAPRQNKPPKKKGPGDPGYRRPNYTGGGLAPGAGLGGQQGNPNPIGLGGQAAAGPPPGPAPQPTPGTPAPAPASPPAYDPTKDPTNPAFQVTPNPGDEALISNAWTQYGTDTGAAGSARDQAAIAYGDPTILATYGLPATVDPNSALAQAAYQHQLQTDAANASTEQAGNFFTSVHGLQQKNIDTTQANAQQAGWTAWQKALGDYTTAMTNAQIRRDNAIAQAHQDEIDRTVAALPTTAAAAPAAPAAPALPSGPILPNTSNAQGRVGTVTRPPVRSIIGAAMRGHPNWFPNRRR